jgi:hypothetical protein
LPPETARIATRHGSQVRGFDKLLILREADDERIERLRTRLGIPRKVDVVRTAMDLLEAEADRQERVKRWKRAAALAAPSSRRVNVEFRQHSRLKRT